MQKRKNEKFYQTERGKELKWKWNFIRHQCLMYADINLNILSCPKGYWINYFNDIFDAKIEEKSKKFLPKDTIDLIYTFAGMPEYQHGTGCKCDENNFSKDKCPKGKYISKKIAKKLNISIHSVNNYLELEGKKELKDNISFEADMHKYLEEEKNKTEKTIAVLNECIELKKKIEEIKKRMLEME